MKKSFCDRNNLRSRICFLQYFFKNIFTILSKFLLYFYSIFSRFLKQFFHLFLVKLMVYILKDILNPGFFPNRNNLLLLHNVFNREYS